jgi:ABC-type dipeptide/oligopeptide/nickel transport system permease component
MLLYTLRRIGQTVPAVLGVVTLVFLMVRFLPGDPAAFIVGEGASQEAIDAVRRDLGLDKPILQQYADFLTGVAVLDLGQSVINRTAVTTLVGDAIGTTVLIGGAALLLGFLVAVPLGAFAAYFGSRGKGWLDQGITGLAIILDVIPGFWLALVFMLFFTLKLGWLPATGPMEWGDPVSLAKRIALPVMVLTLSQVGVIARITRTSVLEVLADDYVRTARAMGTPEVVVLFRHALRNAALPVVTVAGLSIGRLLGGAVILESIFALPGMGTVLINGIQGRDYPVVQGIVLVFATMVILVNLATDLVYTRIDPRVKL